MPKLPETIVLPVGVDIHDHFREPSPLNQSETFESGTLSALLGGYGVTVDMPNTPGDPTWTFDAQTRKQRRIMDSAYVYTGTYAGSQPEQYNLLDLGPMSRSSMGLKSYLGETTGNAGDVAIEDILPVWRYWHGVAPDRPIMVHRGNADLEEIIALVAKEMRHQLHICHVNHPDEADIVAKARKKDLPVTCGVCPHHLFMTSHDVMTKGTFAQMQPPLAHQVDAEKLMDQLVKGKIDLIETDHAPHSFEKKMQAEHDSGTCYGVPGIKETIPQLLNQVRMGRLTLERLIEVTSTKPAEVIGIRLSERSQATFSNELYQIDDASDLGRAYVSPYVGNLAVGRLLSMKLGGKELVADQDFQRVSNPLLMRGQLV